MLLAAGCALAAKHARRGLELRSRSAGPTPPRLPLPAPAGDQSRTNWWVGLLGFGEGWHNNHHAFEFSARHGLEVRPPAPPHPAAPRCLPLAPRLRACRRCARSCAGLPPA